MAPSPTTVSAQEAQSFSYIDPASRIQSAISAKQLSQKLEEQRSGDKSDPTSRWKRGRVLASQLNGGPVQAAPAVRSLPEDARSDALSSAATSPAADDARPAANQEEQASRAAKAPSSSFLASKLPFVFRNEDGEQRYIQESEVLTKRMEEQNWLEMLDPKHRYGSNLKFYHRYWNVSTDTDQNFLHWLDEGDGKHLSLEECPRSKLEAERIVYLTPDQRRNYMAYIDTDPNPPHQGSAGTSQDTDLPARLSQLGVSSSFGKLRNGGHGNGRLRWCRTGELVNTSKYDHGDLGQGRGIALRGSEEWQAAFRSGEAAGVVRSDKVKVRRSDSGSSSGSYASLDASDISSIEGESELSDATSSWDESVRPAVKPTLDEKHQSKREQWLEKANLGPKYWVKHKLGLYAAKERQQFIAQSPGRQREDGEVEHSSPDHAPAEVHEGTEPKDTLIRRKKADTWLFVADLAGNLYIGIKTRGRFQHSSLLGGHTVAAAGVLKVKDGIITSIYPYSGHYRSGGEHFEALVDRLRARGLDTSGINVRKSKLILKGINRYGRYRKAKDRRKQALKDKVKLSYRSHFGRHGAVGDPMGSVAKPCSDPPGRGHNLDTVGAEPPQEAVGSRDNDDRVRISAHPSGLQQSGELQSGNPALPEDHERAIDHCARAMSSGLPKEA
ncbi:hypothetical protein ACQY0O_004257 [Thecaphora frezii]